MRIENQEKLVNAWNQFKNYENSVPELCKNLSQTIINLKTCEDYDSSLSEAEKTRVDNVSKQIETTKTAINYE